MCRSPSEKETMMRSKTLGATTALLFGLGLAAAAAAQGPGGGGPGGGPGGGMAGGPGAGPGGFMLQRFDADGDGKVSEDEFRSGHTQTFDAMDGNKDGVVGSEEMTAYVNAQRASRKLSRMDANADGKVTRDEFGQYADARFTRADANHDKALTADELARRHGGKGPGGKAPGTGPGGVGPGGGGTTPQQQ
jgi:Ca2+-binding EF-hand superfamily protein